MAAFCAEYLDERIVNPTDDLITRLLATDFEDEHGVRSTLTRDEARMYLTMMAGAGNHTTNRLIGCTGKVFADHADARRELLADPSLIANAIEELLRYEPSSTQIARYVARDVELHGLTMPEGSAFLCLVGAANRDDGFRAPGALRHSQQDRPSPYVRVRSHFCLGASLVRLEGRVALEEVLKRFPE